MGLLRLKERGERASGQWGRAAARWGRGVVTMALSAALLPRWNGTEVGEKEVVGRAGVLGQEVAQFGQETSALFIIIFSLLVFLFSFYFFSGFCI